MAGERPLAGEEFQSIMRNQTLGLPGRFDSLDALERAAIDIVSLGYPDDYYANYAKNVRALDERPSPTRRASSSGPTRLSGSSSANLEKVEAGIRELKLGEVVRLDASGKSSNSGSPWVPAPFGGGGRRVRGSRGDDDDGSAAQPAPAPAQTPAAPLPPLIREGVTEKISAHVYVIPDNSVRVPNVGIVVGSRATLVMDTGLGARNGEAVMREVGKVSRNAELIS